MADPDVHISDLPATQLQGWPRIARALTAGQGVGDDFWELKVCPTPPLSCTPTPAQLQVRSIWGLQLKAHGSLCTQTQPWTCLVSIPLSRVSHAAALNPLKLKPHPLAAANLPLDRPKEHVLLGLSLQNTIFTSSSCNPAFGALRSGKRRGTG